MIKRIILSVCAIFLAFTVSSYIPIEKKSNKDTVLVKVDVNQHTSKAQIEGNNVQKELILAIRSFTKSNELKQQFLDSLNMLEDPITDREQLYQELDTSPNELYKKARADTSINFWCAVLCLIILLYTIYFIITLKKVPWQNLLVIAGMFIFSILIFDKYCYEIISYLFNRDYETIKKLLILLK